MGDPSLVAALSMEAHQHPSTLLSMDSSASSHDELDLEMNPQTILLRPPDINLLPLSAERSPRPPPLQNAWNPDQFDILDVTLGTAQVYEPEALLNVPKAGRKLAKRVDSIWGAWFFFSFYFKPVVNDKSVAKIMRDGKGVSGFDKSDLKLDVFMVQHDMENMYMWIFKERPENALGKMQLRSYMNGHSRHGDRPFPYSVDKGFVRSHRMQRKHYRGLSNPQCIHGIEVIPCPNLASLNKEDRRRWVELTGREINFSVPPEASAFGVWRNLPNTDFELERPMQPVKCTSNSQTKKLLNGSGLNLSAQMPNSCNGDGMDLSPVSSKRRKGFFAPGGHEDPFCVNTSSEWNTDMELHMSDPQWLNEFSGVMKNVNGPVTAAKTIYEDDEGYLIIISLPFVDLQKVKVSWRNTPTRGIIKVSGVSVSRAPFIRRNNRTFKLSDPAPEHCPSGEFIREITLSTRIPEEANIKAYCPGSVLEITVPKLKAGPEEHEVHVCLRPHLGGSDLMLT